MYLYYFLLKKYLNYKKFLLAKHSRHKADFPKNDKFNPILNGHKSFNYTNIKLPHFPNIFRSILTSFYLKNILKYILVQKLSLLRVTNKIGKINPILNGHTTVSYPNIKLPKLPNILRSILNILNILK